MIERTELNGRPATVAYLNNDLSPHDGRDAPVVKVTFDDGEVVFGISPDVRAAHKNGKVL